MAYSEAQKMAWLEKLGNFDPQDPKPGNYKIIICPATSQAFADRAATQVLSLLLTHLRQLDHKRRDAACRMWGLDCSDCAGMRITRSLSHSVCASLGHTFEALDEQ